MLKYAKILQKISQTEKHGEAAAQTPVPGFACGVEPLPRRKAAGAVTRASGFTPGPPLSSGPLGWLSEITKFKSLA